MRLSEFELFPRRTFDESDGDEEPANESIFLQQRQSDVVVVAAAVVEGYDESGLILFPSLRLEKVVQVVQADRREVSAIPFQLAPERFRMSLRHGMIVDRAHEALAVHQSL